MALDFKASHFAHPLLIARLRGAFRRHERIPLEQVFEWRDARLRAIVEHAYRQVPYYAALFRRIGLVPSDIRRARDLDALPILDRETVRREGPRLRAENSGRYSPVAVETSGTTGQRLILLMDKPSNALEFAFYWRAWGWAGYHLGDRFAEFSSVHFHRRPSWGLWEYRRLGNRLLLDSRVITEESLAHHVDTILKFRPRYLKGLASVLGLFASHLERREPPVRLGLQAVFSSGETLTSVEHERLRRVLRCPIFNLYGHMERTVAASTCLAGALHVHPDYGLMELLPHGTFAAVVGTSLHNRAMPLLRYATGDLVVPDPDPNPCTCGLAFPRLKRVLGRAGAVLKAPDGRSIPAAFLIFDEVPGVTKGQIVQELLDRVVIRVEPNSDFDTGTLASLRTALQRLMGPEVDIIAKVVPRGEEWARAGTKFAPVIPLSG
jgi:phenylacetate-CoA ligase